MSLRETVTPHSPSQQRIQFFSLYSSMIEDLFSSGKQIFIRYDFISLPSHCRGVANTYFTGFHFPDSVSIPE